MAIVCKLTTGPHSIMLDTETRFHKEYFTVKYCHNDHVVIAHNATELANLLRHAGCRPSEFVGDSNLNFIFIVCILNGKPHSTLWPNHIIWRDVERRFGTQDKEIQITEDYIRFTMVLSHCPRLRIHEGIINMHDLSLVDHAIIDHTPWPEGQ